MSLQRLLACWGVETKEAKSSGKLRLTPRKTQMGGGGVGVGGVKLVLLLSGQPATQEAPCGASGDKHSMAPGLLGRADQ